MRPTLYITADGLLQPLGYSQVVRIIKGLANTGVPYDVISLERQADLDRPQARAQLKAELDCVGIGWAYRPYSVVPGARGAAENQGALVKLALGHVRRGGYRMLHARSYLAGPAALAAKLTYGVPYLFDARSYWVDERLDEGRWFTNPIALGIARGFEHRFFADAAAVVTLTELQADDVREGKFGPARGRPIVCIPTCADYDAFGLEPPGAYRFVPEELVQRLRGKLVLGFIGSLNRSYLAEESAALAAEVLRRRPDALVVATSPQLQEYAQLFARHGIPPGRTLVQRVDHQAMPEWLTLVTWGMLLLDTTPAKRASMPTKLAEFFAAGVRVVHYGCNSEVGDWVRRAGAGLVLTGVSPAQLRAAAEHLAGANLERTQLARDRTKTHFSLAAGIERYKAVNRDAFQ